MPKNDRYLVALDLGSSKVGVLIGELAEGKAAVSVLGKGTAPARGMRKGNIVDVDQIVDSVKKAVEEAEIMAGVEVAEGFVGSSGPHIRSFNSRGAVPISSRDRHVTRDDVTRAVDAARSISIPPDREIIHVIPRQYLVDEQEGVADPVGMVANRLAVDVHVVTGAGSAAQTMVAAINRAGIAVKSVFLEALAGSAAALTPDERDLGCLFLDIGGGSTDYALYQSGSVAATGVLPIGGEHFTKDLSVVLKTPVEDAERIKKKYGCLGESAVDDEETIEVPSFGGRPARLCSSRLLRDILAPRAEELFQLVKKELANAGFGDVELGAGVTIGGGGAELDGVLEVAESTFGATCRKAVPIGISGLVDVVSSPEWITATGLLLLGAKHATERPAGGGKILKRITALFGGRA